MITFRVKKRLLLLTTKLNNIFFKRITLTRYHSLPDLSFFPINRSTIQCLIYIGGAHVHTQTRTYRTL